MNIFSDLKSYRWNSLFVKYIKITFLVLFVPFFIIYIFLVVSFFHTNITQQMQSLNNASEKISYQFELITNHLSAIKSQIESDTVFKKYLSKNTDITNVSPQESSYIRNYLLTCSQNISGNIHSIYLYSDNNNYVMSTKHSSSDINSFFDLAWYNDKNYNEYFNVVYSPSYYPQTTKNVLSFVYRLQPDGNPSGTIVFNIDISEFLRNFIDTDINAVLYDEYNDIVYSYNDLYLDSLTSQKKLKLTYFDSETDIARYSLHFVKPRSTGFSTFSILAALILMLLVFILAAFIMSVYLSSFLYSSINRIITNLHNVLEGHISTDEEIDEISHISKNMLNIITKSKIYERELEAKALELKGEQIRSMQYQINPHFLFNSLNTINMVAMTTCDNNDLSTMIILLSDIIENVMDSGTTFVPLHFEIDTTKKYTDLLAITQSHQFDIVWNLPNNLKNYSIPKLIIQPLIENAFEHGIKHLPHDVRGLIKINVSETNSEIKIEVSNNGPLIPYNDLKKLNDHLSNSKQFPKKHIGLINTSMRIKLIYGDKYGCSIRNTATDVVSTIVLPKTF